MARTFSAQKAALTRVMKLTDPERRRDAVENECRRVKKEWGNAWPDDWSRWQRALNDTRPWNESISLDDL
ncbi:hypothetical protein SEA_RASPUTIA_133 [Microbacterium phage Rasputia]|nr:hypothetical protein SEA_RASPUTIA_133 [Microbacterium phage Rasputia]